MPGGNRSTTVPDIGNRQSGAPVDRRLERLAKLGGRPEDALHVAVEHAILAPSQYNTQPWKFTIRGNTLELLADRTRALRILDPDDRELTISCGAALLHLRLALHGLGLSATVAILPEKYDPDVLARLTIDRVEPPSSLDRRMLDAMLLRRTHRKAFMPIGVGETLLTVAADDAESEGAMFNVVRDESSRAALVDLISEADRIQWSDPLFRDELAAWAHPNRTESRDGLPAFALGLGALASPFAPMIIRRFDAGNGHAATDRELATESPVLAVLGTESDSPADWLAAGQALERVLLRLTVEGAAASFLSQPVEVVGLRARVAEVARMKGFPQVVLRIGYCTPDRGTPRRDADDTIVPPRS